MVSQEDKIRLIHEHRTALVNRMFDELRRKSPSSSTVQLADDRVATAKLTLSAIPLESAG